MKSRININWAIMKFNQEKYPSIIGEILTLYILITDQN